MPSYNYMATLFQKPIGAKTAGGGGRMISRLVVSEL